VVRIELMMENHPATPSHMGDKEILKPLNEKMGHTLFFSIYYFCKCIGFEERRRLLAFKVIFSQGLNGAGHTSSVKMRNIFLWNRIIVGVNGTDVIYLPYITLQSISFLIFLIL
jgi:hypothetical protein